MELVCIMLVSKEFIFKETNEKVKSSVIRITHCKAHCHPDAIELIIVLKGMVNMRSSYRHITLNMGDTFTIDPGDIHCIYSQTDSVLLSIHINIDNDIYTKERLQNCFFACEIQHLTKEQMVNCYALCDNILAVALNSNGNIKGTPSDTTSIYLKNILNHLVNNFDWLSFAWDPLNDNPVLQDRCQRIIGYCQSHYMEKISLSMFSSQEHLSENYFSVLMKKTSFGGFSNMLNFIRCDAAQHMILETDLRIIEISSRAGFSDPKYFYKYFNKWWGISPAKLRKWYMEYAESEESYSLLSPEDAIAEIKEFFPYYHIRRCLLL